MVSDQDNSIDEQPSGPNGLPLIGVLPSLFRKSLGFVEELAEHGDVVQCNIPKLRMYAVFHPDDIEQVLLEDFDTFRRWGFDELREFLGIEFWAPEGLIATEGKQWRRQRHRLQPLFGLDRLRSYSEAIVEHTNQVVDEWEDGDTLVLNEVFSDLSLAILTHTLFDLDIHERGQSIKDATSSLNEFAGLSGLSGLALLLPSWVPISSGHQYQAAIAEFNDIATDLIDERQEEPAEYNDLLARILQAEPEEGYSMSQREIPDQMLTFLLAGHETTATALTFICHQLAAHPEKHHKLADELNRVLGDDPPSPAVMDDLPYLQHVVQEGLRLYPPAPNMFREAVADTTIHGYEIPQGTKLMLSPFATHRDERWFSDPKTFRPERWGENNETERPDYAYFPFGGGPRHCIGMRFAEMELHHVIAILVQRTAFELQSTRNLNPVWKMTLEPADDIVVTVRDQ